MDGPKTRAATKILTRAASRQQTSSIISSSASITSATLSVAGTLTKVKSFPPLLAKDGNNKPMASTIVKPKDVFLDVQVPKPKRRISNEFEKTEDSLYVSALEDITESIRLSGSFAKSVDTPNGKDEKNDKGIEPFQSPCKKTPEGVEDYDLANWNDVFQVSHYANDIFTYLKSREPRFVIPDYMERQPQISKWMRALLVDWMVEIQESFELNHETLYLAVKIVDIYLSKSEVHKEALQLLGATALFIASKYDVSKKLKISRVLVSKDNKLLFFIFL